MEMLGKMIMSEFGKEGQRGKEVSRRFDVTDFHGCVGGIISKEWRSGRNENEGERETEKM